MVAPSSDSPDMPMVDGKSLSNIQLVRRIVAPWLSCRILSGLSLSLFSMRRTFVRKEFLGLLSGT